MMQRVQQFMHAITAQLTAEDVSFVQRYLTVDEARLFYAMHVADQYHAVHTAYTAQQLLTAGGNAADERLLLRCALLHDVGRRKEDMGIHGKVLAVLLQHFMPWMADILVRRGEAGSQNFFCHICYIYVHHAEIGAHLLVEQGLLQEAAIIAGHHKAPAEFDPPELLLLRQADERN